MGHPSRLTTTALGRDPIQEGYTMKRRTWTVEPRPDGSWAVQRDGTKRADSLHKTKPKAIARAVSLGKAASPRGQVRIKNERGRLEDERTYGNDPRRTRG